VRTRPILLSAAAAFSFGCFGQDEVPAKQPTSPEQTTVGKLPRHVRLFLDITRGDQFPARPETVYGKVTGNALPNSPAPRCGHILVKPVTPETDPGLVIRPPSGSGSRMPIYKGLPPCPTGND